jgi:hypothetical protein
MLELAYFSTHTYLISGEQIVKYCRKFLSRNCRHARQVQLQLHASFTASPIRVRTVHYISLITQSTLIGCL